MAKLEKDIASQIKSKLELCQLTGTVIWWARLNTGKIKTEYGKYVQLCPKGTPDYISLIRGKNNEISVLFIECKSDTGTYDKEGYQKAFADKYNKLKDVKVILVRDIGFLNSVMETIEKNLVNEMSNPG